MWFSSRRGTETCVYVCVRTVCRRRVKVFRVEKIEGDSDEGGRTFSRSSLGGVAGEKTLYSPTMGVASIYSAEEAGPVHCRREEGRTIFKGFSENGKTMSLRNSVWLSSGLNRYPVSLSMQLGDSAVSVRCGEAGTERGNPRQWEWFCSFPRTSLHFIAIQLLQRTFQGFSISQIRPPARLELITAWKNRKN